MSAAIVVTAKNGAARPPGRPRSEHVDRAIICATLEILLEEGVSLDALSMGAVCARAGVGKATLYRRWSSKEALLSDLITLLSEPPAGPAGGSVRGDLIAAMRDLHRWAAESMSGRLLPHLLCRARSSPGLFEQYLSAVIEPRRAVIRGILDRGLREGALDPGLDVETTTSILLGSVLCRSMLPPDLGMGEISGLEMTPELAVELLLSGIGVAT